MDRLWIRFSFTITAVVIFAALFAAALILLTPWFLWFPDEDPTGLSLPPLTPSEMDHLINTLLAQELEQLNATIYADGFFSINAVSSPDRIEVMKQALNGLESILYIDTLYFSNAEPLLPPEISGDFDPPASAFFLEGQLPPEQVTIFAERLPADELLIINEPLLVENLSLIDIFQLFYQEVWPAVIISAILGIGLGIWLSRTLTSPLSRLAQAARAIGHKDLSRRVTVKGSREMVELADAFNQMAGDLERAELLRRQMMADVSHELRTPLTGLASNLRAALDKVHRLEEEDLAHLYGQTNHLIQLVNDLHEITLAEAGQLPLNIKETNLAELMPQTIAMFVPLAEEKGIKLTYNPAAPLQAVKIDDLRFRQVLHNLLANAVRHTPPGGEITVALNQNSAASQISIKDTGNGIAPDHMAHIFDRFYRTDPSRNRETGGTGLGLAIAQAIVKAHQGTLTAASPGLNCGATFTITLPLNLPNRQHDQICRK